ncbi:MAG: AMP-binding protein [Hyphomonadaceae bacterium]|nr:AMP-binding protein [Hyphomonadaceae bacterium]
MTHSLMVPAMYNLILLNPRFEAGDFSAWHVGGFGGASVAPATIARFAERLPGLSLMNAYGSTETTSPVTIMPPSETIARQCRLRHTLRGNFLVMNEQGCEVPTGEEGELWLGGPWW